MATKQIAWQTGSGNITLTYTGQGDGTIGAISDINNGGARSQIITIQTTKGGIVTKNITVSQAACPFPVGDIRNFSYTGNVQSVELPAGSYKLQCWGAQGGSNAPASEYGITAKAGGNGGYSEGVLTLSSPTTVYIFVGGQGSSSGNGGWNGGGGSSGSSTYNSGDTLGVSRFGCGGGATDIALVTSTMSYSSYRNNRSSASLLSRIIVAGGGSGGAMAYKAVTTSTTQDITVLSFSTYVYHMTSGREYYILQYSKKCFENNTTYYATVPSGFHLNVEAWTTEGQWAGSYDGGWAQYSMIGNVSFTTPSNASSLYFDVYVTANTGTDFPSSFSLPIYYKETTSSTTTSTDQYVGYVGGGTTGDGYAEKYKGKQNAAGTNAAFGLGANDTVSNYRYCGGAGGGGWYGGGSDHVDSNLYMVKASGGGSGFVNISASAGNRPSDYTGIELDSGETKDGNTSFPAPSGGNETGHTGNGYARITRLS